MQRKLLHIILGMFLLVTTTGVTFSMHYCGGRLVSASVNKTSEPCCNSGGCCHDKTIHFQLKENFVSPVQLEANAPAIVDLLIPEYSILNFDLPADPTSGISIFSDTSPPTLHARLALMQTYLC